MENNEYIWKGIVLTSIDVVPSPTEDSPNRVTFSASTPGRKDDSTATFLHQVKEIVPTSGKEHALEAISLTVEEVQALVNNSDSSSSTNNDGDRPILFTVHGFMGNPRGNLLQIKYEAVERFQKFTLIPVLWPSAGSMVGYFRDRTLSKAAGIALRTAILEPTNTFRKKSLLCHSMGNRVMRNFAHEEFQFDNIFMCAPDVNDDLFNKSYIDGGGEEWRKDGLRIQSMLKDGGGVGKIHVIYNRNDSMLMMSTIANFFKGRLGRNGPPPIDGDDDCLFFCKSDEMHPDLKDSIVAVDWTNNNPSDGHNYQYDWETVIYYEKHS